MTVESFDQHIHFQVRECVLDMLQYMIVGGEGSIWRRRDELELHEAVSALRQCRMCIANGKSVNSFCFALL